MVVPYVRQLESPKNKYLVDLDAQMSGILNKEIPVDEKIKLYNQTLRRFMINYNEGIDSHINNRNIPLQKEENIKAENIKKEYIKEQNIKK